MGEVIIDFGWTIVASLIYLGISFITIKFQKNKTPKKTFLTLGIISAILILAYLIYTIVFPILNPLVTITTLKIIFSWPTLNFILALIIGNSLYLLLNKFLLKKI